MAMYAKIKDFGPSVSKVQTNPLSYCLAESLDSQFLHGGIGKTVSDAYGKNCQAFMSDYCAGEWNDVCEYASQNKNSTYPNHLQMCGGTIDPDCGPLQGFTQGEILIRNTAAKKYLKQIGGDFSLKWQPFDPTVADSPLISTWEGSCQSQGNSRNIPVYEVDPNTIDNDHVMNKILAKPSIAWGMLVNIHNTALRKQNLHTLKGTKIYNFFQTVPFQNYIKEMSSIRENCRTCM